MLDTIKEYLVYMVICYCCVVFIFREALALSSVLNMPDRADWKNCQTSKDEENKMVAKFRQGFKKFDFTLK